MFFFKKKSTNQSPTVPPRKQPFEPVRVIRSASVIEAKSETKTYHKITGSSHYIDNILELASENLDYDLSKKELIDEGYENEKIYQYDFYPSKTELVPEPDNPHDPNAIKVIVDDLLVGYIKAGSCRHVLKLLRENRILKLDCSIRGGNYKYLGYDEDEEKYYLEKGDSPYFVDLTITEQ